MKSSSRTKQSQETKATEWNEERKKKNKEYNSMVDNDICCSLIFQRIQLNRKEKKKIKLAANESEVLERNQVTQQMHVSYLI
jgi:hypothetical protein